MTPPSSMPQSTNPLDALEPNILPDPIGFWPPAIGWWVLAALVILIIAGLIFALWRWRKRNAYRREALKKLNAIKESYESHKSPSKLVHQYNHLLKAVALQQYPREQVAALHGSEWLAFLDEQLKDSSAFSKGAGRVLGNSAYSPNINPKVAPLHSAITRWVKKHRTVKGGQPRV